MDNEKIELIVNGIRDTARKSDELAHMQQDELYEEFIRHVANSGIEPLASQAKLVISVESIKFSRWYA